MIDWTDILGEEHKEKLTELYKTRGVEELAAYLGVAKNTLRMKMLAEGITMKPRGVRDPATRAGKSRLDSLDPKVFARLSVAAIAKMFDIDPAGVYKFAKRRGIPVGRKASEILSREDNKVQADEVPSNSAVDE